MVKSGDSNRRRTLQLRPRPYIGDPSLVTQYDDFDIARDGCACIAARRGRTTRTTLRVGDFAGATLTDGTRDAREHACHLRFLCGEHTLARQQHARQKPEDDGCARKPTEDRDGEDTESEDAREAAQQIAGSTKPAEKGHESEAVERRDRGIVPAGVCSVGMDVARMAMAPMQIPAVKVADVQMPEATEEGEQAQRKPDSKTDEIPVFRTD